MIKRRVFGNTGVEVSEIGLGCWALGGNAYGPVSPEDAREVMEVALEGGIDLFDTADIYGFGESEKRVGLFLKETNRRQEIFLATKGGFSFEKGPVRKDFSKKHLSHALDQSLERLGVDRIDLYQLHLPAMSDLKKGECLEFLREAKQLGKIRFAGASLYHPGDIEGWTACPEIDSIQFPYNLLERGLEEEWEHFTRTSKALISREIFACGFLSGKYSPDFSFAKDDHRRAYSGEQKQEIFDKMSALRTQNGWSKQDVFESAMQLALTPREVSCALIGVRNREQFEIDLDIYQKKVLVS